MADLDRMEIDLSKRSSLHYIISLEEPETMTVFRPNRSLSLFNMTSSRSLRTLILSFGAAMALIYVFTWQGLSLNSRLAPELDLEASYSIPLPSMPYEKYHNAEYDTVRDDADMKDQKFLYMANYSPIQGFGNALQEYILNSYLAYSANRTLVSPNYTSWKRLTEEWVTHEYYNNKPFPTHVPWSSILTGRLFVDPLASPKPKNPLYRPIGLRRFKELCPNPININTNPLHMRIKDTQPHLRIQAWDSYIAKNHSNDQCLQMHPNTSRVFGFDCFHSPNLVKLWPGIKASGILDTFGFSDLIMSAFRTNKALFTVSRPRWHHLFNWGLSNYELGKLKKPIAELMVVHVRQGDWWGHCNGVQYHWGFQGFNRFEQFPDEPEVYRDFDNSKKDRLAKKLARCFPSIEAMVTKIGQVRTPEIKQLYIMTNGKADWVQNFTQALNAAQQWDKISSSLDVRLTRDQSYYGQVLDTYVGRRANVFIGNGWSSMTSNVALLRLHDEHANTTRFW